MRLIDKSKPAEAKRPDRDLISGAVDAIKKGGVVLFPTQCLYGLGADALNVRAVEKIFRIKQRPENNPILVLVPDRTSLEGLVTYVPASAERLMKRFWPGGVTLVFGAVTSLSERLTAGTGKIGIRQPKHPIARALVREFSGPLTGTSANLSGQPGCFQVGDLDDIILNQVDMVISGGKLRGGVGSTVVDITEDRPKILREGAVSAGEIFNTL